MTSFIAYGKSTFCGFSKKLKWVLVFIFQLLHLSLLTVLCFGKDHSNIFNYMPKYIIVFSCVALHSPFVLDKISFAVHFSSCHRELAVPTNFHVMEIPALLLTGQTHAGLYWGICTSEAYTLYSLSELFATVMLRLPHSASWIHRYWDELNDFLQFTNYKKSGFYSKVYLW